MQKSLRIFLSDRKDTKATLSGLQFEVSSCDFQLWLNSILHLIKALLRKLQEISKDETQLSFAPIVENWVANPTRLIFKTDLCGSKKVAAASASAAAASAAAASAAVALIPSFRPFPC